MRPCISREPLASEINAMKRSIPEADQYSLCNDRGSLSSTIKNKFMTILSVFYPD